MDTTKNVIEDGKLIVFYSDERIDSNNASDFHDKLMKVLADEADKNLIIDMNNTVYISSAAIRVLISAQKTGKLSRIINVSKDVYEILEMTGVSRIIKTEAKLRNVSVEGLELLGVGTTGIVYKLDEDKVIKVFNEGYSFEKVSDEQEKTRIVLLSGVPCAVPYDIVKVNDQYALIFELVAAKTLSKDIRDANINNDKEAMKSVITTLSQYAKMIHSITLPQGSLPSIKKVYMDFIKELSEKYMSKEDADYAFNVVNGIEDSNNYIHGDLNFANVVKCEGEMMLIDVVDSALGNGIFDINIYVGLYYLGQINNDVYKRMELSEENAKLLMEEIFNLYYEDFDSETKKQRYKEYIASGIIRLFMKLKEDGFLDLFNKDQINMFAKYMYEIW